MKRSHPQNSIMRNLFAYGASEIAAKASRLLVVIVVARSLDLSQIGVAAAALAAADILKSLTENGVGQKIIAAPESELAQTCVTAHRIFWMWCLGLFLVQVAVGFALYAAGGSSTLLILILLLAAEYLFMPAGLVQAALAMRAGKLQQTAAIAGAQVVGANIMSVGLALFWPSAIALILPRLLTAPFWLVAMRRLHPWQADHSQGRAPYAPFIRFGWAVLGVEIVKALRMQADKIIVGFMMGAEALGLYFMAFNAGLSLATSFSVAFSTVLFPYLCSSDDQGQSLRRSILLALGLITPVVVLQAILAPWYVPILFGAGWDGLSTIVSILCLVAIPTTLWSAAAGWLRANDRPQVELSVTVVLTAALMLNTVLLAPLGLAAVASGYAIVATVVMVGASLPALSMAFGQIAFFKDQPADAKVFSTVPSADVNNHMLLGENPVCTMSNVTVRKDVFRASGGFDPSIVHNEDLEWLIRIVGQGARVVGLNALHTYYRTSTDGLSSDLPKMLAGRDRALATAAGYGVVPTGTNHAIHHRYLARCALRLGQGRFEPLRHALTGLAHSPSGFLFPLRRCGLTFAAALSATVLPSRTSQFLFSR